MTQAGKQPPGDGAAAADAATAAPGNAQAQPANVQNEGGLPKLLRMAFLFVLTQYVMNRIMGIGGQRGGQPGAGGDQTDATMVDVATSGSRSKSKNNAINEAVNPHRIYRNIFRPDDHYEFWVHLVRKDYLDPHNACKEREKRHCYNDFVSKKQHEFRYEDHFDLDVPVEGEDSEKDKEKTDDATNGEASDKTKMGSTAVAVMTSTTTKLPLTANATKTLQIIEVQGQAEEEDAASGDGDEHEASAPAPPLLLWHEPAVGYSDASDMISRNVTLPVITNPESAYITFTARSVRKRTYYHFPDILQEEMELTRLLRPKKHEKHKKLLGGEEDEAEDGVESPQLQSESSVVAQQEQQAQDAIAVPADEEEAPSDAAATAAALLSKLTPQSKEEPHWISKIDMRLVYDVHVYDDRVLSKEVPNNPLSRAVRFPFEQLYQPLTSVTDFWNLEDDYIHLNGTQKTLPLTLQHYPTTLYALAIQKSMHDTMKMKGQFGLVFDPMRELFMMKRIFLNNSPMVLIFSFLFMMTHSIFSWLAFKNELSFWRKNKSMKGLSARSMVISWFCRLVIALYLLDSRETSYIILFEIGMDLFLSTWKLTKAVKVELGPEKQADGSSGTESGEQSDSKDFSNTGDDTAKMLEDGVELVSLDDAPPASAVAVAGKSADGELRKRHTADEKKEDKTDVAETSSDAAVSTSSSSLLTKEKYSKIISRFIQRNIIRVKSRHGYEDGKTSEYDRIAIQYMSYILYPLMLGYTIYSLFYNEHKSWYSFCLKTFAGYIYMFGFIMMTPQLYINYRLKSVEHMPWRAMTYKALNTFVDDVSAFLMDMPWMHRLSCLRDDVIFIAYLYQRWAYRVDKSRPTAFSDGEEGGEQAEKKSIEEGSQVAAKTGDSQDQDASWTAVEDASAARSSKTD